MTIRNFIGTFAFDKGTPFSSITYLVFGGQGSVYVSKLEYCPASKQVKLLSESKELCPVTMRDLLLFPKGTEILIEGYPGDDTTPLQWVTPDHVEFNDGTIDFQRLLTDEQHKIIFDANEELHGIIETLRNHDIPEEEIKKIFDDVIQDIEYENQ